MCCSTLSTSVVSPVYFYSVLLFLFFVYFLFILNYFMHFFFVRLNSSVKCLPYCMQLTSSNALEIIEKYPFDSYFSGSNNNCSNSTY